MLLRLCSARARLETGLVSGCERLSKPLIKGLRPFTPGTERAVVVSSPTTRAKSPAGGRAATPSTAVARVCGEKWRRDAENAEVLRKCRSREYRESAGGPVRGYQNWGRAAGWVAVPSLPIYFANMLKAKRTSSFHTCLVPC